MTTSYFANVKNLDESKCVAISNSVPTWFKGRVYKPLVPSWAVIKKKGDWDDYTETYYATRLDHLDPQEIYEELGEDSILICFESPNKKGETFNCHRRLVAEWFEEKLGVKVPEIEVN